MAIKTEVLYSVINLQTGYKEVSLALEVLKEIWTICLKEDLNMLHPQSSINLRVNLNWTISKIDISKKQETMEILENLTLFKLLTTVRTVMQMSLINKKI